MTISLAASGARPSSSNPSAWLARHARALLIGLGLAVGAGVIATLLISQSQARAARASELLFAAEQALTQELTTQGVRAGEAFDVGAKLPRAVSAYERVSAEYPKTRAAFEAQVALAHLYLDHGQTQLAAAKWAQAAPMAKDGLERAIVELNRAHALEGAGDFAGAVQAADQVLKLEGQGRQREPALKGDALLLRARALVAQGNTSAAIETYARAERELDGSDAARTARVLKLRLSAPGKAAPEKAAR